MKILITGSNGQLGKAIKAIKNEMNFDNFDFYFLGKEELDITQFNEVNNFISNNKINVVINCAAWTNCESAEDKSNWEKVKNINVKAPHNIALSCLNSKATLIHISTDYIFDGKKDFEYIEEDTPNPLSIYGKTKLMGERKIIESGCNYVIIRTSGIYSLAENSFFYKILSSIERNSTIKVVNDIYTSPTCAYNLAYFILSIIKKCDISNIKEIINYSDGETMSWYDFAREIEEGISNSPKRIVEPINHDAYKTKVNRPLFSSLAIDKAKKIMPYPMIRHKEWINFLIKLKNMI